MWFAIALSILFLAITTIFFTTELRKFPMYRSLAFFFLFEGFYTLIDFIVIEIWPNFKGMSLFHNAGCLIFGVYVVLTLYRYKNSKLISVNSNKEKVVSENEE